MKGVACSTKKRIDHTVLLPHHLLTASTITMNPSTQPPIHLHSGFLQTPPPSSERKGKYQYSTKRYTQQVLFPYSLVPIQNLIYIQRTHSYTSSPPNHHSRFPQKRQTVPAHLFTNQASIQLSRFHQVQSKTLQTFLLIQPILASSAIRGPPVTNSISIALFNHTLQKPKSVNTLLPYPLQIRINGLPS